MASNFSREKLFSSWVRSRWSPRTNENDSNAHLDFAKVAKWSRRGAAFSCNRNNGPCWARALETSGNELVVTRIPLKCSLFWGVSRVWNNFATPISSAGSGSKKFPTNSIVFGGAGGPLRTAWNKMFWYPKENAPSKQRQIISNLPEVPVRSLIKNLWEVTPFVDFTRNWILMINTTPLSKITRQG